MAKQSARSRNRRKASKPRSIRDLEKRDVRPSDLIKIPVTQDDVQYVIYSRQLSLGASAAFARLQSMGRDDPTRGVKAIAAARDFLRTHVRDEDGSEIPTAEIEAIIDSLDMDFAAELTNSMIEYITGGISSEKDSEDASGKVLLLEEVTDD